MNEIIKRYQVQTLSAQIHRQKSDYKERQCNCLRSRKGISYFIDLFKNPLQKKAYYKGLQTCNSVFSCPICAVKITEHRKKEIEELLEKTQGYYHYLITLTIPHYKEQSCKDVHTKFKNSRRRFKNWNEVKKDPSFIPYRKIMKHYQYDGSVTTVEVTYGQNGWHIHSHELIITKKRIYDLKKFRDIVLRNWEKSVTYSDIEINNKNAFYRRSVQIDELRGGHINRMTQYLTKIDSSKHWGIPAELSKGNMKKSENDNLTPFGMLHKINDTKEKGLKIKYFKKYSTLFFEYCKTFKGTHHISFTKGLKAKYGISALSDEEIVEQEDPMANFYGMFELPQWKEIKKLRLRGFIISNSTGTWEQLQEKLNDELIKRSIADEN